MADRLIEIGNGFWNIRGTFRVGGLVQIGTQASLVRLRDGRFVLLDSYTLPDAILGQVRELTDDGKDVDAIINVHPFHTIHVAAAHQQFPAARLFGTARHVQQASDAQLPRCTKWVMPFLVRVRIFTFHTYRKRAFGTRPRRLP